MPPEKITQLDPIIHSRIRLAVLSILASVKEANFTYLKDAVGTTDGNLSVNITKLEEAGYIAVKKTFRGKKPLTSCTVTTKGKKAFSQYLKALDDIVHFKGA
jgi:DNA-binding MarR family transcriptional regulator